MTTIEIPAVLFRRAAPEIIAHIDAGITYGAIHPGIAQSLDAIVRLALGATANTIVLALTAAEAAAYEIAVEVAFDDSDDVTDAEYATLQGKVAP